MFSVRFRIALANLLAIEPALLGVSVSEAQAYANERHSDCCLGRGSGSKDSSGEYFDVNLHTQMASSYEAHIRTNSVDCNFDKRIMHDDDDDDDLLKTNV